MYSLIWPFFSSFCALYKHMRSFDAQSFNVEVARLNLTFMLRMISVTEYTGEFLVLHRVRRKDMGAFFCIAKNMVPPSVSKRIMLNVNCKYYFGYTFLPK